MNVKEIKRDIKKNPQYYRGNVKLLSGDIENNLDKEIRKMRRKVLGKKRHVGEG